MSKNQPQENDPITLRYGSHPMGDSPVVQRTAISLILRMCDALEDILAGIGQEEEIKRHPIYREHLLKVDQARRFLNGLPKAANAAQQGRMQHD